MAQVDLTNVSDVGVEPGTLPQTMAAWVIRPDREGEPMDAFQLEEIEVPEPGAFEVIVRVMAAGVNYNNVWAALDPAKAGIGRTFTDSAIAATLSDAKLLVVAFSGPDCPVSKLYKPKLDRLSKDYSPKGVRILTVSSDDKGRLVEELGAVGHINRQEYDGMMRRGGESPEEEKARFKESRRFAKAVSEVLGGQPDVVFEHVGQATFPTSVLTVKPFGKVVICAGTTGYNAVVDLRYLWTRQKRLQGSHFANDEQAAAFNQLVVGGRIDPCLSKIFDFEGIGRAHQLMSENRHPEGNMAALVCAPSRGLTDLPGE